MALSKPPLTKYLDPSSAPKTIDLVNVCRRLIADWQYHDMRECTSFAKVTTSPPGAINPKALSLITKRLVEKSLALMGMEGFDTGLIPFYLRDIPITLITGEMAGGGITVKPSLRLRDPVTAKNFKAEGPNGCLKPQEAIDLYWRLRTRFMNLPLNAVIAQLFVKEFKKLKYDGFLLPNGKVVPLDSMYLVHFTYAPKEVTVIDYVMLQPMIEDFLQFNYADGFLCYNIALVFNLPEKDDKGKLGRVMIIDPFCAQFGMKGERGELVYSGYLEDYMKRFPAKKINVTCFFDGNIKDPGTDFYIYGDSLTKASAANLNSDFCGYCGEVEREENPEMKLKKCSRCKKASYCDALCQKMAWKSHKLECKQEE